jgi:hypothetical protein
VSTRSALKRDIHNHREDGICALNSSIRRSWLGTRDGEVVVLRERRIYSVAERNELWERWRRGESISEIGRSLDRAPGTIFCTLTERGRVALPHDGAAAWL